MLVIKGITTSGIKAPEVRTSDTERELEVITLGCLYTLSNLVAM